MTKINSWKIKVVVFQKILLKGVATFLGQALPQILAKKSTGIKKIWRRKEYLL
jgi:hypothetical protein